MKEAHTSIWQLLFENLGRGPATLRYPAHPAPPAGFRGPVRLTPERCVGCGACAYVCAPGAIQVTDQGAACRWAYDAGQCTFCGRCVDLCPCQALAQQTEPLPPSETRQALQEAHEIPYPLCAECGQPAPPLSEALLARALAEITPEVRRWSRLCPRCRAQHYQPALLPTEQAKRR